MKSKQKSCFRGVPDRSIWQLWSALKAPLEEPPRGRRATVSTPHRRTITCASCCRAHEPGAGVRSRSQPHHPECHCSPAGRPPVDRPTGSARRACPAQPARRQAERTAQEAITEVLSGEVEPQLSTAAPSSRSARSRPAPPQSGDQARDRSNAKKGSRTSTSSCRSSGPTGSSCFLVEFGNERHPSYPDQDTDPLTPGPVRLDGPGVNEIPEPEPTTTPRGGSPTTTGSTSRTSTSVTAGRRVAEDLLRAAVVRPLHRRRRGHRLGQGRYNEARYGRSRNPRLQRQRRRVPATSATTPGLVRDGMNQWVADQQAAGRTDAQIAAEVARSTCSTATTSTATATSTSPTAISTGSRSSTPAATRPTATRSRARTPSGATAGTRSPRQRRHRPENNPARRNPDRRHWPLGG